MPTRCVIARHRPDRRSIAQRRHPARQRLAADLGVVADIHRKTRMKHDALHPRGVHMARANRQQLGANRSEEHTSELQSLMRISYAVFCLKKKSNTHT